MNSNDYATTVRIMVDTIINSLYKEDKSDHTFKAMVVEVMNPKKYKVLNCGKRMSVTTSIELKEGDYVWVCAPNNNWDNLFVVSKS